MHFPNIRKNRHMTDATGKKIEFILILLALMVLVLLSKKLEKYASGEIVKLAEKEKKSQVIVLDAGHGGSDPGKIGVHEEKEKEINLEIALKVEKMLKKKKIKVIMTRTDDQMLDDQSDAGQKVRDLRERVRKINGEKPVFAVSIHQNSLPSSKQTHGAQVFYGKKEGSAEVANAVQLALNQTVNAGNEKTEKAIDASIFLMKNVTAPAILIECGFLSNENETALLKSGEYQQRLAVVIASGLLQQQQ